MFSYFHLKAVIVLLASVGITWFALVFEYHQLFSAPGSALTSKTSSHILNSSYASWHSYVFFSPLHSAVEWLNIGSDRYQISCDSLGDVWKTSISLHHASLRVVMQACVPIPAVSAEVDCCTKRGEERHNKKFWEQLRTSVCFHVLL